MAPTALEVSTLLRPLLLKDLRNQCRARGITPAGSRDALLERIQEHMLATGNLTIVSNFTGELLPCAVGGEDSATGAASEAEYKENALGALQANLEDHEVAGFVKNNYVRPEGQNVGNFLTGRSSSRVLAPPGGASNISFG